MTDRFNLSKILTPAEWRASMLHQVAYIKPVCDNGRHAYSIHAADGTELAVMDDRDEALAVVLSQDLVPASVH